MGNDCLSTVLPIQTNQKELICVVYEIRVGTVVGNNVVWERKKIRKFPTTVCSIIVVRLLRWIVQYEFCVYGKHGRNIWNSIKYCWCALFGTDRWNESKTNSPARHGGPLRLFRAFEHGRNRQSQQDNNNNNNDLRAASCLSELRSSAIDTTNILRNTRDSSERKWHASANNRCSLRVFDWFLIKIDRSSSFAVSLWTRAAVLVTSRLGIPGYLCRTTTIPSVAGFRVFVERREPLSRNWDWRVAMRTIVTGRERRQYRASSSWHYSRPGIVRFFAVTFRIGLLFALEKFLPAPYYHLKKSYPENRTVSVRVNNGCSSNFQIPAGVP